MVLPTLEDQGVRQLYPKGPSIGIAYASSLFLVGIGYSAKCILVSEEKEIKNQIGLYESVYFLAIKY